MNLEIITGIAVAAAALGAIGVLLVWSFSTIDRIAEDKSGSLRKIMKDFKGD